MNDNMSLIDAWKNIKDKYESSKIVVSPFVQNFAKKGEIIYLITIALVVFQFGLTTTMLREISELAPVVAWVDFVVVTLLWIKVLISAMQNLNKLMIIMGIILIMQMIVSFNGDGTLMTYGLLIIGAEDVEFDRIVKTYLFCISLLLLSAFMGAQLGYIKNLKYYVWGRGFRYALGGVYPTDTMCHVFFIVLGILYLLKGKFKIWMAFVIGIATYVIYYYTNAQTGWLCTLIALIGFYVVRLITKMHEKGKKINERVLGLIRSLLIWSMPIGAICFAGIVGWYMCWNRLRTYFPSTIASRIGMTAKAFRMYGIPIFGCPIQMVGNGGKENKPSDYFFIDCSYMWVIFVYGLVVLLIFLGIFILIGYKFKSDWYMLVILFAIAVDCTIEHHWMDISYNIFMVALLAKCGNNKLVLNKKMRELLGKV